MKRIIKSMLIISFTIVLLNVSSIVWASSTIEKTIQEKENFNINSVAQELQENGKKYIFSECRKCEIVEDTKIQTYTSEEKILNSNNRKCLDTQFKNTYIYEDEKYKGELVLKNYSIQEIDNGYQEKIDSKYIFYNNLPTNDLEQIVKSRIIEGREYVLINVDWFPNNTSNIDGTTIPISYNGKALYQCVIRINNPKTYNVQAVYEGEVKPKEVKFNYVLTYTEVADEEPISEDTKNHIVPVAIASGGMIFICILGVLLDKNATVYNVQKGKLLKLKSKRIRANSVINITDCENISGNCFILSIKESSYQKLRGKTVYVQFNNQKKELVLTTRKTCFRF